MWGEVAAVVMKIIVFDPMHGLFSALAIWIDYMGYATMHFCQTMFIMFLGGLDLFMLLLQISSETFRATYFTNDTKKTLIYIILGFEVCRMIIGFGAYTSFRKAFYY